jgi:hypothetical protein
LWGSFPALLWTRSSTAWVPLMNAGRMTRATTAALSERGYNFVRGLNSSFNAATTANVAVAGKMSIHLDRYFHSNNQNSC